jgi:hypothetical protein
MVKNKSLSQRLKRWLQDFGSTRAVVLTLFFLIALLGWYLDWSQEGQSVYLLCDCGWGEALGYIVTTIGPDLGYIVIGYLVLDFRIKEEGQRSQLLQQMGSEHPDVTDLSVREMARRGWLYNGTLDRANLGQSHMAGADLSEASLAGVNLRGANLKGADMYRARLTNANLTNADLTDASLKQVNASRAILNNVNLTGGDLTGANLTKASLRGANLQDVTGWEPEQLADASTLAGATMPDGTRLRESDDVDGPSFAQWRERHSGQSSAN